MKQEIARARKDLNALKRAFPTIWFQGAFELELIDVGRLGDPVKRKTVGEMLGWPNGLIKMPPLWSPSVLLHAHFLLDAGAVPPSEIKVWLGEKFSKASRQVLATPVRSDQELQHMAWNLGSYPFKDRVQYNMTFATDTYEIGSYFNDTDLARLILLYDRLGKNGFKHLLIGSGR